MQLQPLVDALQAEVRSHGVMHTDETPVAMLAPGTGKTHGAHLWAYSPGVFEPLKAVVYDFTESRAGSRARAFLGHWQGKLVCDDDAGYKNGFAQGITEVACMAHARRKFFELHAANKSVIAGRALEYIGTLYEIEREARELGVEGRLERRQARARPVVDALHAWMLAQRSQVPDGTATAKALDYSLKRWAALTRYVDDGQLPIDNNWIENQIRPIAIGRNNWLFAGSLRAGQRAAAIMSLIQSAKLNGLEPHAYLKDVLTRGADPQGQPGRRTPASPVGAAHRLIAGVKRGMAGRIRVAGISGVLGGLLRPARGDIAWRVVFLAGFMASPLLYGLLAGPADIQVDVGFGAVLAAGFLVGVGTRYGPGCTSGHGVCGLSRLSPRSLVATLSFMAAGFATVFVLRHHIG